MDLAAIGAPSRPSDFERHADGRILVTNPDAPELVRCAWPAGPCQRIPVDLRSLPAQEVLPLNAAKLHIDEAGGRYFISDNAGYQVLVTDFAGKLITFTRPRIVRHPNQLALVAPDRLAVVDTDNRRIATFDLVDGKLGSVLGGMSTAATGVARPGRSWPFDSVRLPDGATAVLIATLGMKNADLVFFDASGTPRKRADLGEDADPFDAEVWRGSIWVADATRYRFDAVRFDGSRGPGLEDTAFLVELDAERSEIERWKWIRQVAQYAVVGIPLLGALLLWRLGVPSAAPAHAQSRPAADGIRWLEPDAAFMRRVRLVHNGLAWVFLVFCAGWSAYFMVRYRDALFSFSGVRTGLPAVATILLVAVVLFVALRSTPRMFSRVRLGVAADALHVEAPRWAGLGSVRTTSSPWAEVYHDGARLLAGNRLVPVQIPPWGRVYSGESIAAVTARMPESNAVSRAQLGRLAMKAGAMNETFVVLAVGLVAGLAALGLMRLI